ncbi:unnamed protein product [Effrenium voratum]|nr:unnamed protein product [Effrenium voratum]
MPNVRTLTRLACLVACADLLGVSAQIAQKCNLDISPRPRQDQTLKLIKRSWASHSLVSEVAAILLEEVLMYDVERVYPDTTPAQDIRSLSLGEADVNFEVWQGGKERELHTWVRNGSAVIAGSHAMVSFDGMYTLRHTIERFPEDAARKPPQQTLSRGESLLQSLTASLEAMSPSLQALSERDEENDILGDLPQVLQRMRSSGEDALAASTEPLAAQAESSIVESLRQSRQDRQAEPSPSLPRKLEESAAASPPRSETGILRDADSRSSSKDSSADSRFPSKSRFPDSRSQSKDAKNVTGKATASRAASHRAARFDRDDLKRISEEMQDRFVEKMEHFTLVARMARLEESLENQLGREGFVTAEIEDLKMENRYHVEEKQKLQQQLEEIREATAGNTCRIRDDQHRLENAADHAYRTAKHLEEVSSNFSVTKEVLGEDIGRMAKAVQVLANEFRIIEEEHRRVEQQKAHELKIAGHAIKELQEQIGKQEVQSGAMESDLIQVKQQFGTYAKQAGVQRLEKRILDMQEETGRLQEFVHEKFLTIQDAERREMMSAFAAKWDPYNKSRLLRKTVDGWVEFLRRQNRSREALQSVKQIYAKTHVTARLRSWWRGPE